MKIYKYILLILSSIIILNSCSDDDDKPGNPVLDIKTEFGSALFGDSLPFTINVSDQDVPLSTLKAKLYYGDEMVSEVVVRTKTEGDYSGKIFVPYYANIPNGTATLEFVLQNINLTITQKSYDLPLSRPDFPYLTLITSDEEIRMERTGLYQYAVTQNFPMKVPGYIKAPAVGTNGNEISFGWEDNAVIENSETKIPFSNFAGEYAITFNTQTYDAAPFIIAYTVNDIAMERVDDNNYKVEMEFTKGQELEIGGIDNLSDWWIDPNFLNKADDGKITFAAQDGKYRFTANFEYNYFIIEVMSENSLATLQTDGSGAVWVIGDKIGNPSFATNSIEWGETKAICMVPLGNKKYQISLVAGVNIPVEDINFKFFHQKGWGGEFGHTKISTKSDLVFIGENIEPGPGNDKRGDGNLGLYKGKTLESGATYVFTVDLSAGNDAAVLTVTKK
ncbi:MAG: DUF5125 domain-containing protein [Dysgonomonas sp.]|nr:DUF5125 domain-containing protein [Dysgonomonas sp.]